MKTDSKIIIALLAGILIVLGLFGLRAFKQDQDERRALKNQIQNQQQNSQLLESQAAAADERAAAVLDQEISDARSRLALVNKLIAEFTAELEAETNESRRSPHQGRIDSEKLRAQLEEETIKRLEEKRNSN